MHTPSHAPIPVGIVGITGTVGRQFLSLLENHPWFQVRCVAASARSAGRFLGEALKARGIAPPQNEALAGLKILDAARDIETLARETRMVFSAVSLDKAETRKLEEAYAAAGLAVISNNSAHRWTDDVPMIIPEVNPEHAALVDVQRRRRGWKNGLIAVKSNCSIQSYVPVLHAWKAFDPERVMVATYQAVSGAGRTLADWPEMRDNVIPLIGGGEEEKSEREPLKVWGAVGSQGIVLAQGPMISATCIRVPVSDGHLAVTHVAFKRKPEREALIDALNQFRNPLDGLDLPSAPSPFLVYREEADRPQTALDRDAGSGMAVTVGRLREDTILDYKFVALSHNTLRGAAGGAVLMAELLTKKGYVSV